MKAIADAHQDALALDPPLTERCALCAEFVPDPRERDRGDLAGFGTCKALGITYKHVSGQAGCVFTPGKFRSRTAVSG